MTKGWGLAGQASDQLAAAAVAMVAAHMTPGAHRVVGFDTRIFGLPMITPRQRLNDILAGLSKIGGGGTNCDLPIAYAAQTGWHDLTGVLLITDNESWAGPRHTARGLAAYRQRYNPQLRAVCMATRAYSTSLGDPGDPLFMDVVGFDALGPQLAINFLAGRL